MSDLELIERLGDLLRRPLIEVSEERLERHFQARYGGNRAERINRDAYSLAENGTVSGLLLQPVTSEILYDFPLHRLRDLKHLYLPRVNLHDWSFLSQLTGLTTIDLRNNSISDGSALSQLTGLTTIDLRNNSISDGSALSQLTGLTSLDLSNNNISNWSFLSQLTGLTSLYLRNNSISDWSFLSQLTGLTTIDLSNNNISDGSFLSQLTGLTTIDLSHNNISDGSFLSQLTGLTSLDLSNSNISDWSFLSQLIGLTSLDLSNNNISDGSFLSQLTGLTTIDLSNNNISDGSFLSQLTGLTTIDLSNNNISDGSFLSQLTGLTTIDLSNNVSDWSFLSQLTGLTTLYLSNNNISDGSFLSQLTGLTSLDLSNNNISDWSFLSQLIGLTTLYLSNNNISDGSFLSQLIGLTTIDLSNNNISDGSFLSQLTGLTTIDLSNNNISDGSSLNQLTGLTTIDLSSNSITKISRFLAEGRMAVDVDTEHTFLSPNRIYLRKNPIEEPPLEIVREGSCNILNYYDQLAAQGQDYLYEAKMLIVGEGEAGKTTLAHKIHDAKCPLPHIDDRTRGISIQTHRFPCRTQDAEPRDFQLNIWDFGGQEIYHATHRFFLSKRSLYVLVADNRKDDTDFNYWLNIIQRFAGNSPLIIVLNEKGDIQRSLNRADLRGRYPDSIKEILSVNFKTQEEPDQAKVQQRLKGINVLIGHIQHQAQHLSHIGEPVPARWVDVRQAIEDDNRDYIYREQFDELCNTEGITNPQDIGTLLSYFNDLGVVLHFDKPFLRNHVILNPDWATNAVYRIFDDDDIKAKAGRFDCEDCVSLWRDLHYHNMHDVLFELMKTFRLVYEIGTSGNLVAPQLLPPNTPKYDWDATRNSHMQLRYDAFMPKGIFWQLAVTLYRYIPNHDWVWRSGMVIQRGNTWAEITEDLNLRRISLRFSGPSIAEFRAVVVDELDHISSSYHGLQYDKMIPCQCSECQTANPPHFYDYAVLKRRQETGKKSTIECQRSEEDVDLRLLLEGFAVRDIVESLPDKKGDEPAPPGSPPAVAVPLAKGDHRGYPKSANTSGTAVTHQPAMRTIKIFLASSNELKGDRQEFEIFINRQNKQTVPNGIFLELVIWEDFLNALSKTRSQDEYNNAIAQCDLFVLLAYTKVGQYTEEEFLTALEAFKDKDRPRIWTYFKNAAINTGDITPEIMTLLTFKQQLSDMGHFYSHPR